MRAILTFKTKKRTFYYDVYRKEWEFDKKIGKVHYAEGNNELSGSIFLMNDANMNIFIGGIFDKHDRELIIEKKGGGESVEKIIYSELEPEAFLRRMLRHSDSADLMVKFYNSLVFDGIEFYTIYYADLVEAGLDINDRRSLMSAIAKIRECIDYDI